MSCAGAVQELCRSCAGAVQELCRSCAGAVQEFCRISAGALQKFCRNSAGMGQRIGKLQEGTGAVQELCRIWAGRGIGADAMRLRRAARTGSHPMRVHCSPRRAHRIAQRAIDLDAGSGAGRCVALSSDLTLSTALRTGMGDRARRAHRIAAARSPPKSAGACATCCEGKRASCAASRDNKHPYPSTAARACSTTPSAARSAVGASARTFDGRTHDANAISAEAEKRAGRTRRAAVQHEMQKNGRARQATRTTVKYYYIYTISNLLLQAGHADRARRSRRSG
jgi:hypothetical protein